MKKTRALYLTILVSLAAAATFAQSAGVLKSHLAKIDAMAQTLPIEKLYLQTDKPYYTLGDTLHFKSYVLNGDFLTPSVRSGQLYVELDDSAGRSVQRILVPVEKGTARCDFILSEETATQGSYTLRAYTSWMRNFGEDYIFKKDILVLGLHLHTPTALSVATRSSANIDLQFMPEGGRLVADVPTRIGFKAIGEDGLARAVSGRVYDSHQQRVADFQSLHKGMGSFELTPQKGESYMARLDVPGGNVQTYQLPSVSIRGTALRITSSNRDSLTVRITTSSDSATSSPDHYLLGMARGVICYAAPVIFSNGQSIRHIATNIFPGGIAHFTLLNTLGVPLNQRLVYIAHQDNLQISIGTAQSSYTTRDSIVLDIQVKDSAGAPVKGNFSLAVTDDSQVRVDSMGDNIMNHLLFTSDLKSTIEDPGYYFDNVDEQKAIRLDNLLLTQGWVGYDWKEIFGPNQRQPEYAAEPEYVVKGRVTNLLNTSVAASRVTLFSRSPRLLLDTITGKDGVFVFSGLFPADTAIFKLTALNKHGKSSNIGIEMLNEFKPPVFHASSRTLRSEAGEDDSILLNNIHTKLAWLKAEETGNGPLLRAVVVRANKVIKGSHNLNGPGKYDQALDEQQLMKAGKMTLGRLLEEKIKGFTPRGAARLCASCKPMISSYIDDFSLIYFVIDGLSLNEQYNGSRYEPIKDPERYNFLKGYMDYFTAEDIKGIEVMTGMAHTQKYVSSYVGAVDSQGNAPQFAFIEITTRSGQGPFMKGTPGTYLYKPLPYTLPRQFYSPKYDVKNKNINPGTDLRSTIYWEPDVVTDPAGHARVVFYSADRPAGYTILMEGMDGEGQIGHCRHNIRITALK